MVDPIQGPVVVLTGSGISAESDVPPFTFNEKVYQSVGSGDFDWSGQP